MYSNAGLGYCCLSREAGEINGGNIVWNFWWIEAFFFSLVTKERNWKIFLFECFLFLSFCISVSTIILFEIFRVASFGKFDFC